MVGEVVGLEKELSFFEGRSLFKKRYAVPYILGGEFSFVDGWRRKSENELITGLENLGAIVFAYRTGEIKPVECSLNILDEMTTEDYMIFTSKNAVNAFMWNLSRSKRSVSSIGNAKIAVVGEKTATELMRFGVIPDVVSKVATGKSLAEKLLPQINPSTKVCWFSARKTGDDMDRVIAEKCQLSKIVCYENVATKLCVDNENIEKIKDCDAAIFTSASNAKRFCESTDGVISKRVFSIGPVCRQVLESIGVENILDAETPTYEELIKLCVSRSFE